MATKIAIEVDVKTKDAASEIDELKQQMEDLQAATKELKSKMEGGFKSAEKGAESASKGMKGFGSSIGTVLKSLGLIAIAAEVFNFIKDLLMKNQKVADALGVVFKTIEVLFNEMFKAGTIGQGNDECIFNSKDKKHCTVDYQEDRNLNEKTDKVPR